MTVRTALLLCLALTLFAQDRPGLFFREDWKVLPAALPVTPDHVANPDLIMSLHGPGKDLIKKSHHDQPADDPYYIWSGDCKGNWAISLRHKASFVDLSGQAKIRWRSKQSGFRELRVIVKLADGAWLVSDIADGPSNDWREVEFNVPDIRWRRLNIDDVIEGAWVQKPDLTRVDAIGWSDLMRGGSTPASSRVDWIEVYGKAVPRPAK
jgi:hypothetical protein